MSIDMKFWFRKFTDDELRHGQRRMAEPWFKGIFAGHGADTDYERDGKP